MDLVVACVKTGTKYSFEYVTKLRSMVAKFLPVSHRFVCLSDKPFQHDDIGYIPIGQYGWPRWWAKMALFDRKWRYGRKVIYFDLDTVIVNDLSPLIPINIEFGICENFTKRAGHATWPCTYGSCVMIMNETLNQEVFDAFKANHVKIMRDCGNYGDQLAIERLLPNATLLQNVLPKGFFLGRRDFDNYPSGPPDNASVLVFAGSTKPSNVKQKWIRDAWG